MSKWLIIQAPLSTAIWFPLGPGYISSALKKAGHEVRILDLTFSDRGEDTGRLCGALLHERPEVIGIGGLTRDFPRISCILDNLKNFVPDIPVVAGGGFLSSAPELMLQNTHISYGVIGEGDETVVELAAALSAGTGVAGVNGLVYRDARGEITSTPKRRPSIPVDDLPMPDFEGFDLERYLAHQTQTDFKPIDKSTSPLLVVKNQRAVPIMLSRSCPFPCTFCFHSISEYRQRSLDAIFAEIDFLIANYGANCLTVFDDLFSVNRERVLEFCKRIKPYNLMWYPQLRIDNVDPELIAVMRDAGCYEIGYGLESINADVLASMRKKINPDQIVRALETNYRGNVGMQGNFIFGDSAETVDTVNETLDWWLNNLKYGVNLSYLYVFPGTEIFKDCVRRGLITDQMGFIRQECPIFNASQVEPSAYPQFLKLIYDFITTIRITGQVLRYEVDTTRGPDPAVALEVRCPHCGETVAFETALADQRVICPECYANFHIPLMLALGRSRISADATRGLKEAAALYNSGNLGAALTLALQVVSACPADWEAGLLCGLCLLRLGRHMDALGILFQAVSESPGSARGHAYLGIALMTAGYAAWGFAHLRHALYLDPYLKMPRRFTSPEALKDVSGPLPYLLPAAPQPQPLGILNELPEFVVSEEAAVPHLWSPLKG